jgi:hypothetical protein
MSVIDFPSASNRRRTGRPYRVRGEKNMHTLLFRSRKRYCNQTSLIWFGTSALTSTGPRGNLARIRARMGSLQEYAVTELQLLTAADTKLSAAIVAALLSTRGQR